jgi:hypothetical protein
MDGYIYYTPITQKSPPTDPEHLARLVDIPSSSFDYSDYFISDKYSVVFYVAPNGNDNNDGLSNSRPKQTIQSVIEQWASQPVIYPSNYVLTISLAVGEYTLPDNYIMPVLNRRVRIVGPSSDPEVVKTVVINVHGTVTHAVQFRDQIELIQITIKGSVDTASRGLIYVTEGLNRIGTCFMLGTNKTVDYSGIFTDAGVTLRLWAVSFQNLPTCLLSWSSLILIAGTITDNPSSGNDTWLKGINAIFDVEFWDGSWATSFAELNSGARILGPGDGKYSTAEYLTGELWLDGKPIYKKTFNTGALPNATVKQIAHNISGLGYIMEMRGSAVDRNTNPDSPSFLMMDRPGDVTNHNVHVRLSVSGANIQIATEYDMTRFSESYVTLWYTKS